jgi:MFS family permease
MNAETNKHLRHNWIVNVVDGSFFGLALGSASFVTVLPLFVSTMTNSAILIGLIPAIHSVGWQLPQLLTANRVARLSRYKPMVILMTIHERLPFFGLAAVAWLIPLLGHKAALIITFGLLVWQGLGGGFTATAWQSMIGKIIPARQRGRFFGIQSAAANLFASGGALLAGILLERPGSPVGFAICFLFAGLSMAVSWAFLASTREPAYLPTNTTENRRAFWKRVSVILQRDAKFRWFLAARMLSQLATAAFAFYTVYGVRHHGMSEGFAGLMTSVYMAAQIIANPVMGWIGDRWSHRLVMEIGALAAGISASIAWLTPSLSWFFLAFILAGIANVAFWTISIAMTLEFGTEADRPAYIGLANTLVAPSTILAPLAAGWLADAVGYQAMFIASIVGGLITAVVLHVCNVQPMSGRARPVDTGAVKFTAQPTTEGVVGECQ